MADEKISAMTLATQVANADVAPFVQSGNNVRAPRQLILTAGAGEPIALAGSFGSNFSIAADGSMQIQCAAEGAPILLTLGTTGVGLNTSVNVVLQSTTRVRLVHSLSGKEVSVDYGGVTISYVDSSFNWSSTPTDFQTAIQRLAAAVAGVLGGPIP